MNQRFQRVCDLFEEARHLPAGAERERFLSERCDADVRDDVASMLAHHEASSDPDSAVAVGPALDRVWRDEERARGPAPERIGPYRILSELGAGGSGTVYLAEQDSPKRQVALKVLKANLSAAARERFEREGEILGQLEHEGIARVYSVEGPAIAMELVDGQPLTRYADGSALSVRPRLELLRKVCAIVAHAHQRGVIHRDLKPSNILVTSAGQPKVLDFGLARRIEDEGHTMTGLVMGTLAYMSPEQANAQPAEVDTRTDVYALGVLAYELLAGHTPHRTEGRPVTEVLREIGRGDIEPLPVGGDVAQIVHKALARERERRYQSAGALAEDLERFLNHEPIVARSPTATYLLKKFVRRHKALVGGACAAVLALAVGLVFALLFAREADRNARAAARATARARVEAAAAAFHQGQPWHVARHLDKVPPEHRAWEWRYLRGRLDTSVTHLPLPTGVAFDLEEAALWADPAWRPWLDTLRPAGLRLEGNAVVDARTGRALGIGAERGTRVDATPDGSIVAIAGGHPRGTGILVLNRRRNEELAFVETNINPVFLSPDGSLVACAHADETLEVVRLADGTSRRMLHGHYQHPYAVAFSPDGRFVATGTVDRDVRVHDWAAGKTVRTLRRHGSAVYALAYSADGRKLASGSGDRTVVVWDVEAGTGMSFLGHTDAVRAVGFRDGRLFSVGEDGVRTWDLQRPRDVLRHHRGRDEGNPYPYIYGVAFAPDGRTVVSAGWDKTARVSDVATGRLLRTIETPGACYAPGFAGTGELFLVGRGFIGDKKRGAADRLAVRPGGRELATSYEYGLSAHVLDARTLEPAGWTGFEETRFYDVAYSPDGAHLALGAHDSVYVTDADTGRLVRELKGHEGHVRSVAYHPDGRVLASGGSDRTIVLWDARTGARLRTLEGHVAAVYALAFHPDGRRLASGSNDSTIRLWDPATGAEVLELRGHTSYVYDLAWSPDGSVLASASGDNTVRLWRGG